MCYIWAVYVNREKNKIFLNFELLQEGVAPSGPNRGEMKTTLAQNLKLLRGAKSHEEWSGIIRNKGRRCTRTTASKWERGTIKPSPKTRQVIANMFNISVDDLSRSDLCDENGQIIRKYFLPPELPKEVTKLINAIMEQPEKALAVAPILEKFLKSEVHRPEELRSIAEIIFNLPENQRKGLIIAFGGRS